MEVVNVKLTEDHIKYLYDELGNSQYSLQTLPKYLNSCNIFTTIQYGKVKINIVMNCKQVLPILLLQRIIKRVNYIIEKYNIPKNIIYWFLPIEQIRNFPQKGNQVTPESINGGYTYVSDNKIFIYRLEDFAKVMLHELLHHSIIESGTVWTREQLDGLKHCFNISAATRLLPNEALVETWATYYQLQFVSNEYNIPFKLLYKKECEWAVKLSNNLLNHQRHLNDKAIWIEKTNSFTYIILKTIFLLNLEAFLKIPLPYKSEELYNFIIMHKNDIPTKVYKNSHFIPMRISLFGNL